MHSRRQEDALRGAHQDAPRLQHDRSHAIRNRRSMSMDSIQTQRVQSVRTRLTTPGTLADNPQLTRFVCIQQKAKDLSHVPCKFYRANSCTAGKACPFSHDLTANTVRAPLSVRVPERHRLTLLIHRNRASPSANGTQKATANSGTRYGICCARRHARADETPSSHSVHSPTFCPVNPWRTTDETNERHKQRNEKHKRLAKSRLPLLLHRMAAAGIQASVKASASQSILAPREVTATGRKQTAHSMCCRRVHLGPVCIRKRETDRLDRSLTAQTVDLCDRSHLHPRRRRLPNFRRHQASTSSALPLTDPTLFIRRHHCRRLQGLLRLFHNSSARQLRTARPLLPK